MRNIMVFGAVALATLVLLMMHAGPAYAAPASEAVTNAVPSGDRVVGNEDAVPVQLVMHGGRGGGHVGGRAAFRGAGVHGQSFRSGHFRSYGYAYHRPYRFHRYYRPFFYGSVAVPYYYGTSYNNDCYWNGYQWICNDYDY